MQAAAIATNSTKTGITSEQEAAITDNTAKTGITSEQAAAIAANSTKTGITSEQATAITENTAKTGITSVQAAAITENTAKTGITSIQSDAIIALSAKVFPDVLNIKVTLHLQDATGTEINNAYLEALTTAQKNDFDNKMISTISDELGVAAEKIKIIGYTDGSIVAEFEITDDTAGEASTIETTLVNSTSFNNEISNQAATKLSELSGTSITESAPATTASQITQNNSNPMKDTIQRTATGQLYDLESQLTENKNYTLKITRNDGETFNVQLRYSEATGFKIGEYDPSDYDFDFNYDLDEEEHTYDYQDLDGGTYLTKEVSRSGKTVKYYMEFSGKSFWIDMVTDISQISREFEVSSVQILA